MSPERMPLLWLSMAFLLGLGVGKEAGLVPWVWFLLASSCLALGLIARVLEGRRPSAKWLRIGCFLGLALALGGLRWAEAHSPLASDQVAWYNDRPEKAVLEGWIVSFPEPYRQGWQVRVQVERVRLESELLFHPVKGVVLANLSGEVMWRYGDRLRLEGSLQTPPQAQGMGYRDALAHQGIYATLANATALRIGDGNGSAFYRRVYELRHRAFATINHLLPEPEASLLAGILLGLDSSLPEGVKEAFQITGVAHIVAISGFNITFLCVLLGGALRRILGRGWGALATAGGVAVYCLFAGGSPSVVRAGIFGSLSLLAGLLGRRQEGLTSLAVAAAGMSLIHPDVPWDVSFQLSFTATLGLVLYSAPLESRFYDLVRRQLSEAWARRLTPAVAEYFLVTLAAQLVTLPVILVHFQRLSLAALIANPLILPVQPAVMAWGGLAVILGMIWMPLGQLMAALAWPVLAYSIRAAEGLAQVPLASLALDPLQPAAAWLFYAIVLLLALRPALRAQTQAAWKPATALLGVASLALVVWQTALYAPDGRLHVTLLNTGGGEAILLQTPEGRYALINGGQNSTQLADGLGRRLPLLHRSLDWLIVAGCQEEQLAAVPYTLERFPAQAVLWAGPPAASASARTLQRHLGQAGVPIYSAQTGERLDLGQGAFLEIKQVRPRGAVIQIEWDRFRMLLPIGLDFEGLEQLQDAPKERPVTAVLLADSGFAPLNPPDWINGLQPQLLLISVGAGNAQGLPNPEVLQVFRNLPLLRTDRNGWVHLSSDGQSWEVEVEKQP